jgi:hypothetical protein
MQLREILTIEASIKEVQPHSDSCPTSSSSSVLLFISLFFFHGRSRNSPLIFLSWPETQRKVVANSEKKKKKKKRRSRNSPSSMFLFPQQLSSFFFLLSSPSFPFFPLLSLAERHRETERGSERPCDGEKKLSRRPRNLPPPSIGEETKTEQQLIPS